MSQQDLATVAAELQKGWHDFQAANDERLAQIEKRGEDAVTRDQVERINGELTALKDALDGQSKSIGRLTVGAAGNDDQAQVVANARRFFAIATGKRHLPSAPVDITAYQDYRAAFAELILQDGQADRLAPDFRAALSVGSDRDGGYLVPTETSMEMERRIYDTSPMRQIARVISIGAPAWEAPYKASKGISGGWVGERQARPATGTPPVGLQRIETHEQYAYPEVTQSMLDDAAMDVEGFVTEDTEEEMGRTENEAFVNGDGTMKPRGFLDYSGAAVTTADKTRSWGKLQFRITKADGGFPTLTGGAHDPDALVDIINDLHPNYRAGATWAMNRTAEAGIRKLKDGDGRYFVNMGSIEGGLRFELFGFPIVNLEDMPNPAANSFSTAFGNFRRGYYIIDRTGFRLLRDPYTNKPYVGFYITKRTGGDVRNFDAIKLLKYAAT